MFPRDWEITTIVREESFAASLVVEGSVGRSPVRRLAADDSAGLAASASIVAAASAHSEPRSRASALP